MRIRERERLSAVIHSILKIKVAQHCIHVNTPFHSKDTNAVERSPSTRKKRNNLDLKAGRTFNNKSKVSAFRCLHDQVAFFVEGSKIPLVCSASGPNSCPTGFFCQFSDKNKQFQCCAHKAGNHFKTFALKIFFTTGCPANNVAYVGISGQPEPCKRGVPNVCPKDFSCQQTRDGKEICCTINDPKTPGMSDRSATTNEQRGNEGKSSEQQSEKNDHGELKQSHLKTHSSITCRPNEQLKNGICV
jgi:hypothetical protein